MAKSARREQKMNKPNPTVKEVDKTHRPHNHIGCTLLSDWKSLLVRMKGFLQVYQGDAGFPDRALHAPDRKKMLFPVVIACFFPAQC